MSTTLRASTRFDHTRHLPPSTPDSRHHGHNFNRLLVTSTLGGTKLSSYKLPEQDFTHGRASVPEPVPVADLVAHRFTLSAHQATPVPDHPAARPSERPPPPSTIFGAPSAPNGDIAKLMSHRYAKKLHDGEDEPAYNPFAIGRPVTPGPVVGPPRPNLTSTLRTIISHRRLSLEPPHPAHRPRHRERALPRPSTSPVATPVDWASYSRPVAKAEAVASTKSMVQLTETQRSSSQWKLGRYTEVPSRVPTDGKPWRHHSRPPTSTVHDHHRAHHHH